MWKEVVVTDFNYLTWRNWGKKKWLSHGSYCPCEDLKRAYLEYRSEVLHVESTCSFTFYCWWHETSEGKFNKSTAFQYVDEWRPQCWSAIRSRKCHVYCLEVKLGEWGTQTKGDFKQVKWISSEVCQVTEKKNKERNGEIRDRLNIFKFNEKA
jgi:hypothetical protein